MINKYIKTRLSTIFAPVCLLVIIFSGTHFANAVDNVPDVNLSQQPTSGGPFGAFKILQCDGPAGLNTYKAHQVKDVSGNWVTEKINGVEWRPDPNFVPCDFRGLMIQAQFL